MLRIFISTIMVIFWVSNLYAAQSTIMNAEGYACLGEDKSRKQTEDAAMADAKKKAVEDAVTYVSSVTKVEDYAIVQDIINAYSKAGVKILEKKSFWYKDERSGDCHKVQIKAEVLPDEAAIKEAALKKPTSDNPVMPLQVSLWTDKKDYGSGDKIKIYLKGNKPFYARVLHRDTRGGHMQLLPNPYRTENYFNGGVIYEIPSGNDKFELEVSPPYGDEQIILYASTSPLGDINLRAEGGVYQVKTRERDIGIKTRGVKIKGIDEDPLAKKSIAVTGKKIKPEASEFFEENLKIRTGQ
ncbi:MAG: DUF4384 domain-containing protein [Deltaproteobacteria bacterium]